IADGVPDSGTENSDLACFQWAVLRELERDHLPAIKWLNRAVELKPNDYWYEYYLAYSEDLAAQSSDSQGRSDPAGTLRLEALQHYQTALALTPGSPWVRFSLARLERMRGNWGKAVAELQRAIRDFRADPAAAGDATFERKIGLELGLIDQSLGAWSR